jgi:hypothetical protein
VGEINVQGVWAGEGAKMKETHNLNELSLDGKILEGIIKKYTGEHGVV